MGIEGAKIMTQNVTEKGNIPKTQLLYRILPSWTYANIKHLRQAL